MVVLGNGIKMLMICISTGCKMQMNSLELKKNYVTDFNTMEHILDQSISVGTVPRFYFKHHNDTIQASSGD